MRIPLILLTLLLASCSTYKMDIRQGNYISDDMRDKLRLGMSKQQVHYVLGTPMISDPFHATRWDYVYRLEQKGKIVEDRHLSVYFDGDNLARVEDGGKPLTDVPAMEREADPAQVQDGAGAESAAPATN